MRVVFAPAVAGLLSAHIQFAGGLVRTAERRVGGLKVKNENIMLFLNRLYDLLLQMARNAGQWKSDLKDYGRVNDYMKPSSACLSLQLSSRPLSVVGLRFWYLEIS